MKTRLVILLRAARVAFALAVTVSCTISSVAAQTAKYPKMAPIAEYQMERSAEIALARSAAPVSISGAATIVVLGPHGYETAVEGTNGFVCVVARSFIAPFDWPEFWNPKIRAADCMNPQAARTLLPVHTLRSKMVIAGHSTAEVVAALTAAFAQGRIPQLERGAMSYMMSANAYLTDEADHNMPHLMFLIDGIDARDWGSGAEHSPIISAPFWFFSGSESAKAHGLPPIEVFLMGVPK